MELRPILSAMLRNKTGAVLIALQIAVTLAVVVNAVFIVGQRLEKMTRPSGMDVANIATAQGWAISEDTDIDAMVRADLAVLRAIPGVIGATASQHVPLSGGGWGDELKTAPGEDAHSAGTARYMVDEGAVDALGIKLEDGRGFRAEEVRYRPPNSANAVSEVIVTRALANALFPDGERALGGTVYDGLDRPATIVGIIEQMHGAWVDWDKLDHVMLSPEITTGPMVHYIVRTEPGQLDLVLPQIEHTLVERDRHRVIRKVQPMSEIVARSYRADRSMAVLLGTVVVLLVMVTALGVVGLASFNVKQRTKQIGTRRAIGARRMHIMRYFLVENWLMTTIGVALGAFLALGFNYVLVTQYSLDKLHPVYLPLGIIGLWLLGLASVLGPARRAAAVSPAIATRTV